MIDTRPGPIGPTLLILASCQVYHPLEVDPAAHRAAWHARTLEDRFGEAAEDGLTLAEAERVALVLHPDARLARLRAGRAAVSAEHAGRWADPELSLDVLRATDDVPERWVVTPGLAFSIPLTGRPAAERAAADAETRVAELAVREAEWRVVRDLRRAWIDWSAARLRAREATRVEGALAELAPSVERLAEAGELRRTEAALVALERARTGQRLRRLEGELAAAEATLRAALGLAPEAPATFVPAMPLDTETGRPADLAERSPTLARLTAELELAERRVAREVRARVPDLVLGPLFESDQGQSRWGFLSAFPLPFLDGNRRAIAEARADRELARVALDAGYETLVGRWNVARARAESLAAQRTALEDVLVPLVRLQLEDTERLLELGEGELLVLLESLTRVHETRLEVIDSLATEARVRAELGFLSGPEGDER